MRHTLDEKKHELIGALATARRHVLDGLGAFPAGRADEPFLGVWSVKDLAAHLIGWDRTNCAAVDEIVNGKYPTFFKSYDKDWQSYNQQLVQTYKSESLDELIQTAQASHTQLLSLLEALPPEVVVKGKARSASGRTITIANLLRAEASDEQEHARQIEQALPERASESSG